MIVAMCGWGRRVTTSSHDGPILSTIVATMVLGTTTSRVHRFALRPPCDDWAKVPISVPTSRKVDL